MNICYWLLGMLRDDIGHETHQEVYEHLVYFVRKGLIRQILYCDGHRLIHPLYKSIFQSGWSALFLHGRQRRCSVEALDILSVRIF